jgi:hypothetical protein
MYVCVAAQARLKVQYRVIAEQLKIMELEKLQYMQKLKDAARSSERRQFNEAGTECQRCRILAAELNRRAAERRASKRRRVDEEEPSTDDDSVIIC